MNILVLKTDQPEAELWLFEDYKEVSHLKWPAHQQLAETLNLKIDEILNKLSKTLDDIEGIVCFKGPGSFTGLRIGISVANALAYAQNLPIISATGPNWTQKGIEEIMNGQDQKQVLPDYDRPAATTPPQK